MTQIFSKKWWVATIFGLGLLAASICVNAQVAKMDSAKKISASTMYKVWLHTDSCNTFVLKWNSHCWNCKDDLIVPKIWDVKIVNNKYFIKPQL